MRPTARFRAVFWRRAAVLPPFVKSCRFLRRAVCFVFGHRSRTWLRRIGYRTERWVECRRCGAARSYGIRNSA